jgi:AcrR family transcriptional regulator
MYSVDLQRRLYDVDCQAIRYTEALLAKTEKREPLTRAAVIEKGLALGDAEGLDAVSLRRVASELGVTAMALYRYVESKEELLDAMLELAYAEVELPDTAQGDWWDGLSAIAQSARRVLIGHPAAAAVLMSRPGAGPNALRIIERILGYLIAAGFTLEEAVRVQTTFTRFLMALIGLEASLLPELSEEARQQRARETLFMFESLPSDQFPNLIEAAPFVATPFDPNRTFSDGLELLRAGIESRLAHRD